MALSLAKQRTFRALYSIGFFFGLATALPAYINSEFLAQFSNTKIVGLVFIFSSAATIIALSTIGKFLQRYGDFTVASFLAAFCIFSLLVLIGVKNPILIFAAFIIFQASSIALYFNLDIFLLSNLTTSTTGTIRGTFMSIYNSAWILAPIIAGYILINNPNYGYVYLASLLTFLPVLFIIGGNLNHFRDSKYKRITIWQIIAGLPKHQSTFKILSSNFLLQFFYACMVIYTPIYLHTYMGFDWQKIGIMFTIMLLPFALLEAPLGRIADEDLGEKEMLTAGFLIMGVSTILLAFIPVPDFWLWAAGLLATRIGASTVEIMNETYFFKKNKQSHPDIIGAFRMTAPLAFLAASAVATIALLFVPYRFLFVILGLLMFWGLRYSLTLKDTL